MKTNPFTCPGAIAFGLTAILAVGWSEQQASSGPALQVDGYSETSAPIPLASGAGSEIDSAQWTDIENCTFDERDRFFAGLSRLEKKVDRQVAELNAKRAAMIGKEDTKDWDFNMKEMEDSRMYLKSVGDEIRKALPEEWDKEKDRVNQAWVRTQAAYDKVKNSTTA